MRAATPLVAVDTIGGGFVPTRAPVPSATVDGEVVLVSGADGVFYRLDPIASLIWSCLDGTGTAGEIAGDLAAELGAPPAQVHGDVVAVTRLLGRLCFLEGVECGAPRTGSPGSSDGRTDASRRRLVDPPSG